MKRLERKVRVVVRRIGGWGEVGDVAEGTLGSSLRVGRLELGGGLRGILIGGRFGGARAEVTD